MKRFCLRLAGLLFFLFASTAQAQTEPRLALLIGNSAYKNSPLFNPVNDVRLMEAALQEAGFTVVKSENATIREMRRLIRDFGDRLKSSGGVGLFYFAGHGVQVRGENYLVSTDSDIRNEDEIADDSVNANVVLEKMQTAGNRMNIIILDACRNNPFAVKSRAATPGLATMSAPSGSIVAYSTAPGSVASDGSGKNGLYTEHLAKAIRQPGLPVEEVFKQVRAAVRRDSSNQQTPWENTALEGQFYFRHVSPPVQVAAPAPAPVPPAPVAPAAPAAASAPDPLAIDMLFWESIKTSQQVAEYHAYLARFPEGIFAGLAKARIAEIRTPATTTATAAPVAAVRPVPATPASPVAPTTGSSTLATASPSASQTLGLASATPSLAARPTSVAEGVIGTLVATDPLTGIKRQVDVTMKQGADGTSAYSTGDMVAKDGRVLQVKFGSLVMRVTAGALWRFPLQPGASGEATIVRADGLAQGNGSIDWKTIASDGGKTRIEARVRFPHTPTNTLTCYPTGRWFASFGGTHHLPDSFSYSARGLNPCGQYIDAETAELRIR